MHNSDKNLVNFLVGIPVVVVVFLLGMFVGNRNASPAMQTAGVGDASYMSTDAFAPFWKAWQVLDEKDINAASTTADTRLYGAIQGLASSYGDPYTVFFPPAQSKIFQENIAGDFGGVGMEIGIKNNQLTVVSPLKGTPAALAGVKAGDAILAINGTSTAGMSTDKAVSLIRGTAGTKVTVTFLPVGSTKPVDRILTRAVINIPTIETSTKPGGVFVIHLFSFTATSADLFRNALREFALSGNHKLVLDLRGNPGGYLDAAWDMASYFLAPGKVVVTEDFGPGKESKDLIFRSKGYNAFGSNLQMVILVDAGSASASEILAGALQEQGVAKLVGDKTFGKGSVQELVPITSDTSLKVTVANWLTPKNHNLSHDGLNPDYKVTVTEDQVKAGQDPQMQKALDILSTMP